MIGAPQLAGLVAASLRITALPLQSTADIQAIWYTAEDRPPLPHSVEIYENARNRLVIVPLQISLLGIYSK